MGSPTKFGINMDNKILSFAEFALYESEPLYEKIGYYKDSKNISRDQMPQIVSADVPEFIEFLKKRGVKVSKETVRVGSLKPTQYEYDMDKVEKMKSAPDSVLKKIIMASKDNHILDGHHRYSALKEKNPSERLPIWKIDVPIKDLIKLSFEFPKTFKKAIHESIIVP